MKVLLSLLFVLGCSSSNDRDEAVGNDTEPVRSLAGSGDQTLLAAAPVLAVEDLGQTLRYYQDVLGFSNPWRWEGGDEYGGVSRGGAWLAFNRTPNTAGTVDGHLVWFTAVGVDALYEQHRAAGATIVLELADQPWGFREYRVRDNNGYHLRIAEPLPCDDQKQCLQVGR